MRNTYIRDHTMMGFPGCLNVQSLKTESNNKIAFSTAFCRASCSLLSCSPVATDEFLQIITRSVGWDSV